MKVKLNTTICTGNVVANLTIITTCAIIWGCADCAAWSESKKKNPWCLFYKHCCLWII